jgi:Zn-dependent M28 family amino/carboxypeptidase
MAYWFLMSCSRILPALVEPGVGTPCEALLSAVDPERPMASVRWLARSPRWTPARREEVRQWLEAELLSAGFQVERVPFEISGVSGVNLVAHGPDPGHVLVGAHYDSVRRSPGADDNASGVAVVLEVARALGPSTQATFVWFDAEEPQPATVGTDDRNFAFGSQAFVDAHPAPPWSLALIVESVGYSCSTPGCQQVPGGVPASFPRDGTATYWVVNRSARDWGRDLATYRLASTEHASHAVTIPGRGMSIRQSRFSDHAPFWDIGMDAALLTDTALLRNPHYHRESDTTDEVDPALLADVTRGVVAVVGAQTGRCP